MHEWLADEVSVKKVRYSKDEIEKPGKIETTVNENVTTVCKLVYITESGSGRKETIKTTAGNKVYSKVDYDINCASNGVWLPSSNAISGWGNLPDAWKKKYARLSMKKQGYQFHDAHKEYSKSVEKELKEIAKKIKARNDACLMGCEDPDKKPFAAPQKIKAVLNRLSYLICEEKLKLKPGVAVEEEWAISPHAVGYKLPKK